jgi:chromosome segregation ATPase
MEFRDYAAKETAALFTRLLASHTETSVQHLQSLRSVLDSVYGAIEASATATPEADEEVQELIRRLNTAAGAAARAASQKVQKEMQATLEGVHSELAAERSEKDQLKASLADAHQLAERLRADLQKETERAEAVDRDLDAAIEAHGHVDGQRLEAEATCRQLTSAKDAVERDLAESRGLLDATVADAARIERELETSRNEARTLNETLSAERSAAEHARSEAHAALETANNELRAEREQGDRLTASLAEVEAQVEALRGEQSEAQAQADVLRGELQKVTERAEASDRDLDAAIEAHAAVDAQRIEAESLGRQHAQAKAALDQAKAALDKELQDVRAHLDAANAQAGRQQMQLEASLAETRTLTTDLSAAHAELDAARMQREAITAQLEASRARVQTLERNQQAREDHVRQLESSLHEALQSEASARDQALTMDVDQAQAQADMSALRLDISRLGSLLETSAHAVDDLAAATSVSDLLAALVRQMSTEFSRVALFRVKANRLEGEHQVGFDLTTDVTKLVIPISVDSIMTRAASSGMVEQLTGVELQDSNRVPFGGTPTTALALPIAFQGETLAVVYADSDQPAQERSDAGHEASAGFATLLVRTTSVLLMRLSQELKTLNELREYAAMLIQEAEEMYAADMEDDKSADERRSRLKDTIECARQLYAQRASLEGPAAALLLDDRIAAAIEEEPSKPFAKDLAAIAGNTVRQAESRRTAAS